MVSHPITGAAATALMLASSMLAAGPAPAGAASAASTAAYSHAAAITTLTLEGGVVGLQHLVQFTPHQLRGDLCKSPKACEPVHYFALPFGVFFNQKGAKHAKEAVQEKLAEDATAEVMLFGHSQGGQVIYATLRDWAANPGKAPAPARVSWVSIGNPENTYGGAGLKTSYKGKVTLPPDTAYTGREVIRQYDGWADWPDDESNVLAILNASIGKSTYHTAYWNVNIDDPKNVTWTPAKLDGSPGNVTYIWVPSDVIPLVAGAGPFAPILDKWLRPTIEKAYHRPVQLPDPHNPQQPVAAAAGTSPVKAPGTTTVRYRLAVPRRAPMPAAAAPGSDVPISMALRDTAAGEQAKSGHRPARTSKEAAPRPRPRSAQSARGGSSRS